MGILVLHKAPGERSTACVSLVRRVLKGAKVGHAGTLDSPAEGILVILVGASTRLSECAMALAKEYVTEVQFGETTSTDDAAGDLLERRPWGTPEELTRRLDEKIPAFLGHRFQIPPVISAVHVDGQRAHDLARAGQDPGLSPRVVFVSSVQRRGPVTLDGRVTLCVRCHKGTYIRSIVRDLGRALGCGAHVVTLGRRRCGPFSLAQALSTEQVKNLGSAELMERLLPDRHLAEAYPTYVPASPEAEEALRHGRSIPLYLLRRHRWGDHCPPPLVVLLSRGMALGKRAFMDRRPWFVPHALIGIDGEGIR